MCVFVCPEQGQTFGRVSPWKGISATDAIGAELENLWNIQPLWPVWGQSTTVVQLPPVDGGWGWGGPFNQPPLFVTTHRPSLPSFRERNSRRDYPSPARYYHNSCDWMDNQEGIMCWDNKHRTEAGDTHPANVLAQLHQLLRAQFMLHFTGAVRCPRSDYDNNRASCDGDY